MSLKIKDLRKLYGEYEKKYDELYLNYMGSGSPSTQRTMNKYKDLMEIISLAEEKLKEECRSCKMHYNNAEAAVSRWKKYKEQKLTGMLNFDIVIDELENLKY